MGGPETTSASGLMEMVGEYIASGDPMPLADFLADNSGLPGPRAALEMAAAFAEAVREHAATDPRQVWMLSRTFAALSEQQAPTNDPSEFIAFCGVLGMAQVGAVSEEWREEALSHLRQAAADRRWRIREAVSAGLQLLLRVDPQGVFEELRRWVQEDGWLQVRAAAAGLADPGVLKATGLGHKALELHREIVERMSEAASRSEDYMVLRQGLGYTLSVVVSVVPEEGFDYLRVLAGADDPDVRWVLKENLKKSRLIKSHPAEVDSVIAAMN